MMMQVSAWVAFLALFFLGKQNFCFDLSSCIMKSTVLILFSISGKSFFYLYILLNP